MLRTMTQQPEEGTDRVWVFSEHKGTLLTHEWGKYWRETSFLGTGSTGADWSYWQQGGYQKWLPEDEMWELLDK